MPAKIKPLSDTHARVLTAMIAQHGPASITQLRTAIEMGRNYCQNHLNELLELGLVTFTKSDKTTGETTGETRGRAALLWSITRNGRRALQRNQQRLADTQREVVPPAAINLFQQPALAAPPPAYYRNNGNAHIPRRGVRC
jgi:predicted ArsR family transcriptional regulator